MYAGTYIRVASFNGYYELDNKLFIGKMIETLIKACGITKVYSSGKAEVKALSGIDMEIKKNDKGGKSSDDFVWLAVP